MAKKNSDIKKYGVDLEKEYNDTQLKLKNLEAKILKRAKLLCKLSPKTEINQLTVAAYYHMHPDAKDGLNHMTIDSLLFVIKKIEADYVSKTKQLDAFDN